MLMIILLTVSFIPALALIHPVHASSEDSLSTPSMTWTNITSSLSISPSPRYVPAMVYDEADGYIVLFGGFDSNNQPCNDTWIFSNGSWENITSTPSPSARGDSGIAYDAADGYVVLFGGANGSGYLNDTWAFKNGKWTQINTVNGPSAREGASMAYDSADGYVLLFGGDQRSANLYYGDTWEYKSGVWTQISTPASPEARAAQGMVYDNADGYVLLYGGTTDFSSSGAGLSDTWQYAGGNWTQLFPAASPVDRYAVGMMTYDNTIGGVILFGGWNPAGYMGNDLNDTWEYASGNWVQLSPSSSPAARQAAALVYDPSIQGDLLFGGVISVGASTSSAPTGTVVLSDTWTATLTAPPTNSIVYSVPITITNSQPLPTASPFQEMIQIDSAQFSQYEAANLQNVEFYDSNGAIIPSWLESGNSNTATNTTYWVQVPSIPANSQITIYMGFASPSVNLFNAQTTGEAPQLSSTYGQYDDGANVFTSYEGFASSSLNLPPGWYGSGNDNPSWGWSYVYSQDDYTVCDVNGNAFGYQVAYAGSDIPINSQLAVDIQVASLQTYGTDWQAPFVNSASPTSYAPQGEAVTWLDNNAAGNTYNAGATFSLTSGPGGNAISSSPGTFPPNIITVTDTSVSSNYAPVISNQNGILANSGYLALSTISSSLYGSTIQGYWVRTRACPPNGVMPSASISSVSPVQTYSVSFIESGLVIGTQWSVTFNGITSGDSSDTITFAGVESGTYSFTVGNVSGYVAPPANESVTVASPSSGTITVDGANVNQTIAFQYTVTSWDPVKDSYGINNTGTIWANGGNCYGFSSTALLYFMHYIWGDSTYPYFPSQNPQATSTSDLDISGYDVLNNASLAVMFHQVFGAPWYNNLIPSPSATFPNELEQYGDLIGNLTMGQPVVLILGTSSGWPHAVVAWGAGTIGNGNLAGNITIYLYDNNFAQTTTEAIINPATDSFSYAGYSYFYVMDPVAVTQSLVDPHLYVGQPWWWSLWLGYMVTGYNIVVEDKIVTIYSNGLKDYFTAQGDSQTFVDGIPGTSGIEEGNMQVYAIPENTPFSVFDPTAGQSTTLITRVDNESGQLVGYGYLLNATATQGALNYTVTPSGSGLIISAGNTALSASVTIFTATQQDHSVFQASNMPVGASETANFTVTDWQLLNSTTQTSVTMQVSSVNQPTQVTTYELANGQNGLPQPVLEFPSLILLGPLLIIATLATVIGYRRKHDARSKG